MAAIRASIRYAKALLDLAVEQNLLEPVRSDMALVSATVTESRDLRNLLNSPVVKSDQKVRLLTEIFGSQVSPLTVLFLTLVVKNRREKHLADITKNFEELYRQHKGIHKVTVTSAVPLTEAERNQVTENARIAGFARIELEERVDPALIGGLVIRLGDNQIDNSVASRLAALRREFDTNQYVADF